MSSRILENFLVKSSSIGAEKDSQARRKSLHFATIDCDYFWHFVSFMYDIRLRENETTEWDDS